MKTFLFQRNDEIGTESDDFISQPVDNAAVLNIQEENKFNCILMHNPLNSNCICVINTITLELSESNGLYLSPEEKLIEADTGNDRYGSLSIACSYNDEMKYDELNGKDFSKSKSFDLLNKHYAILIPGGSLGIRFCKAVKQAGLKVNWIEEKI